MKTSYGLLIEIETRPNGIRVILKKLCPLLIEIFDSAQSVGEFLKHWLLALFRDSERDRFAPPHELNGTA
jgi:hypothetical protein